MTYSEDADNCPGANAAIISALSCTVPVATLLASPYSFNYGASIYAIIVATNAYGDSLLSLAGNGAILMTKPDEPTTLLENSSLRTASSITFTWSPGASNGGGSIIDYRVSYAQDSPTYTVIAVNVLATTYTATGLTAGLLYKFKVEARN